jgi:TrmH family RNA methyltransferase
MPAEVITSPANADIKLLRSLAMRKYRRQTGWFLAEGMRICTEAVQLGHLPQRLVYAADRPDMPGLDRLIAACRDGGGRALPVSPALLGKISRKDNPQMVIAAFAMAEASPHTIQPDPARCWIALDRCRDPGNMGTIMRTADAVGAAGIILIGESCDPFSVEAVRASMGAIFNIAITRFDEPDFLAFARRWPGRITGTALPAAVDYRTADWGGPQIIVMGNEQAGLTDALASICHQLVKMPMQGRSDSLNLAVATGLAAYEWLRHH